MCQHEHCLLTGLVPKSTGQNEEDPEESETGQQKRQGVRER